MSASHRVPIRALVAAGFAALLAAACSSSNSPATFQPPPGVTKQGVLVGAQENPAVTTAATGEGSFTVDESTGDIRGSVRTFGLNGTAAHIHEGPVGVNAPVIVPLAQGPAGTWSVPENTRLSPTQLQSLQAGNLYVNVHSAANPGGEVRAQIGRQVYFSTLGGFFEAPPVSTDARGTGQFVFDPATRTLSGMVRTTGVVGTVAHLHTGAVGVSGPVTIPLAGGPSDWSLAPTVLTEQQAADLRAGLFYANVHSAANPAGEIRGQLYTSVARATLSGSAEVPPILTTAMGTGWLSVNPFTRGVAGRIETDLTNAVAAHVHRGSPGVAGPVVIPMTSPEPGVWVIPPGQSISDELLTALLTGELYYNVHTPSHPTGELRGQLAPVR